MTRMTSANAGEAPAANREYLIRPAVEGDAERIASAIAQLVAELRGEDEASLPDGSRDVLRRLVGDPGAGRGLVAEREGAEPDAPLAAVVVGAYMPSVRLGGTYFFIQDFWVAREARSAGVGVQLLRTLMSDLAADGIHRAEGVFPRDSFSGQSRTRRFYQLMGVQEIGIYGRLETEPAAGG